MTTKSWEEHEAEHVEDLEEIIYGSPPTHEPLPQCECGHWFDSHNLKGVACVSCECPLYSPYRPPTTEPASEHIKQNRSIRDRITPTAPLASIEDRAKVFWYERHKNALDGDFFVAGYASDMASFAQAEISRQRPEIERAAVERFVADVAEEALASWEEDVCCFDKWDFLKAMQAVKTRGEQG